MDVRLYHGAAASIQRSIPALLCGGRSSTLFVVGGRRVLVGGWTCLGEGGKEGGAGPQDTVLWPFAAAAAAAAAGDCFFFRVVWLTLHVPPSLPPPPPPPCLAQVRCSKDVPW